MSNQWSIYADRTTKSGRRLTLTHRTRGTLDTPITVIHTNYDTLACMTCLSADTCAHSRWAKQYVQDHPEHEDVAS